MFKFLYFFLLGLFRFILLLMAFEIAMIIIGFTGIILTIKALGERGKHHVTRY
jgi:hypothetical protein